jgi:hypothetical protein
MSDGSLWAIPRLVGAVITSFTQQVQSPAAAAHSQRVWLPLPCDDRGACVRASRTGPRDDARPVTQFTTKILKRPTLESTDSERSSKRQRTAAPAAGLPPKRSARPGNHLPPPRNAQQKRVSAPEATALATALGAGRHSDPGRAGFAFRPPLQSGFSTSVQPRRGSENYPPAGNRAATFAGRVVECRRACLVNRACSTDAGPRAGTAELPAQAAPFVFGSGSAELPHATLPRGLLNPEQLRAADLLQKKIR